MGLDSKDLILNEIPFFADLGLDEKELIKEKLILTEYKKGDFIYKENDPADAFYCLVFGRIQVYTQDQNGKQKILEYLHRGDYFGIISLLTGDNHSVTAKAINDSLLLIIKKSDFDIILKTIPRLAIDLSRTLSRRLKNKDLHQKTIFETTIFSVYSSYSRAGKSVYALNLALSLHKETLKHVAMLEILPLGDKHSLPEKLGITGDYPVLNCSAIDFDRPPALSDFIIKNSYGIDLICCFYSPSDEYFLKKILGFMGRLVNDYHYIILDLPSVMDLVVFGILNQSDLIHILTSPEQVDLEKTHNLINRLETELHFQRDKVKIIINEYKPSDLNYDEKLVALGHDVFATLPKIQAGSTDMLILDNPSCEYARAVRRISRDLGDCVIGLALGVGFAYGFCHIGLLKVIEEENIPVDMISGASVGALIASLWVTGRSSDEILDIVTKEFKEPKYIWNLIDLTFPSMGFLKGNKLYGFLKKYLGNKTFYDVKLPLHIVASDVKNKESKVFNKGLLIDAIMASCSMPGIFMPFRVKEEILLDGGIINPLPTEILFKMNAKKIIAANVTPSRADILKQYDLVKNRVNIKMEQDKSAGGFSFSRYLKDKFKINILDLIFSSVELMQSEMAEKEGQLADIVLHPDTSGLYWLELHRAREFAQRGEIEARKHLQRIKQIVNE